MVTALEIAREIGNDTDLKRKSKVVAFDDLPGVPEGTTGKIALVGGWDSWIRYYVLFDNGVEIGSINREHLAPVKAYQELKAKRAAALESGVFDAPEADEAAAGEGGGSGDGSGGTVVAGVQIPAHLVERSKAARARVGG